MSRLSTDAEGGAGPGARAPPAYEPASAPPAFNPAANINANLAPVVSIRPQPAAVVSPPQPAIRYVDQYGNPIQMQPVSQPQPAVRYVAQYGNQVAPQTGAGAQYVDQYGNPVNIAPPQSAAANIQFVPQSQPQPVVTSAVNVAPPQMQQYVTTQPLPLKPVVIAAAPSAKKIDAATKAPNKCVFHIKKEDRAFVLGLIALILFIIGLAVDSLAKVTFSVLDWSGSYSSTSITCGWGKITSDQSYTYGDVCDADYSDSSDWCTTGVCAGITLVSMIVSMLSTALGVYVTNTYSKVKNPQCRCGRAVYILATLTGIFGIIIWSTGNKTCSDRYYEDLYDDDTSLSISMGWGGSTICLLIGSIFSGIAACFNSKVIHAASN